MRNVRVRVEINVDAAFLIPDDLRQAAVVVATMLYNTAMRDEMLPRPRQP
jgi:hypothetical protein